jgi:CheY-like chemotaxis protein
MLTRAGFIEHLRDALNHLRDPGQLRRNPLAGLFGVGNRVDTFLALQVILFDAIKSLEPDANDPPQSRNWRYHESLYYRYIQQFSQQEVAHQLGISVRHLQREQNVALEILAAKLWEQFSLEEKLSGGMEQEQPITSDQAEIAVEPNQPVTEQVASPSLAEELAWLNEVLAEERVNLGEILPDLLDLALPLSSQYRTQVEVVITDDLPLVIAPVVALNQLLLNLLGLAIRRAPGRSVTISAGAARWNIKLEMTCQNPTPLAQAALAENESNLEMASQLAGLCRSRLNISEDGKVFSASLLLPALEQLPVLAIEDNVDALQMLERYTSGTQYRLIGTSEPGQALDLAQKLAPQIIVLDVMMPQMDGWKLLGRLRQHPRTAHIPVIVCTILPQEELALSLGASAYVRKPITRRAFLAALDQQAALVDSESG